MGIFSRSGIRVGGFFGNAWNDCGESRECRNSQIFWIPFSPFFPLPTLTHALKKKQTTNHVWTFAGNFFRISWILPGFFGGEKIPKFRHFPAKALEKSSENAGKEPKIPKDSLSEHKFWEFWEGGEKKKQQFPAGTKNPGAIPKFPTRPGLGFLECVELKIGVEKPWIIPKKKSKLNPERAQGWTQELHEEAFPEIPKMPQIQVPEPSGKREKKSGGKSQIFPPNPLDLRWNPTEERKKERKSEFLWL